MLAVTAVTALALASILALSGLFAQSDQIVRMATHGKTLQATEGIFSATTAQRGAAAVALLMAEASAREVASEEQLLLAVGDLRAATAELRSRAARLAALEDASAETIEPLAAAAADAGTRLEQSLTEGDLPAARLVAEQLLVPAIENLEAAVTERHEETFALLLAEEGTAGAMARAASIAVALFVPAGAISAYRTLQDRRLRRLNLERQLEHQREQSRIKDEMIANLSHELRTPLTGIYGMALAMQDEGFADRDFQAEMTSIIVREAADLSRMVDDLLTAAKADAGDLTFLTEETDVCHEIEEVLVPFRSSEAEFSVNCEPGTIVADRLRLRQVLRNIVSNAVTHGGGRVVVLGRQRDDHYSIAITDDGPGIPPELEERLFQRFVHQGSAALTAGSVGLGLSIASLLTEGMGGRLQHVRGNDLTMFLIDLPSSAAAGDTRQALDGQEPIAAASRDH